MEETAFRLLAKALGVTLAVTIGIVAARAVLPPSGNATVQVAPVGDGTLSLLAFGADPTGATASDTALRAAIAYAAARGNKAIYLPTGVYRLNGRITVPTGIMLLGEGSQGSSESRGTVLKHYSAGDCLVWDGSGAAFSGTGGGLRDVLIVKADGFQGGTAVRLVAIDDDHRPGEMLFENVLVYGVGTTSGAEGRGGLWAHGLVVDGTAAGTRGTIGVRSIHMNKVRFAEATVPNETVVLNQTTHFFAQGLQIDGGDAHAAQGVTLRGRNEGVFLTGADIAGSVIVVSNDAANRTSDFHLTGKIGAIFDNRDTQMTGTMSVSFDPAGRYVVRNRSGNLSIRSNIDPDFAVARAASSEAITGDGTQHMVVFDTKDRDRGNNFGAMPVNEFVCMTAGRYLFVASVTLSRVAPVHRRVDLSIDQLGSVDRSHPVTVNPGALQSGGFVTLERTAILDLAAGDRVRVVVTVSGGDKSVGIYGAATRYSTLTGKYLG